MNHRSRTVLTVMLTAALTLTLQPAAASEHGRGQGQGQSADNDGLSAEQAVAIVTRTYDGRVVSVKPEGSNGQRVYKVRVLLDGGRVKTVQVDSRGNLSD